MHKANLFGGFNPIEKYYIVNWIISPNRGEHQKYLSCHHLETHKSSNNILQPQNQSDPTPGSNVNHSDIFRSRHPCVTGPFCETSHPKKMGRQGTNSVQKCFFSHTSRWNHQTSLTHEGVNYGPPRKKNTTNDRKFMGFTVSPGRNPFHRHLLTRFFFGPPSVSLPAAEIFGGRIFLPMETLINASSYSYFFPYESKWLATKGYKMLYTNFL